MRRSFFNPVIAAAALLAMAVPALAGKHPEGPASYEAAKELATKQDKLILLDFSSEW